ncbi:WhiB family transcriptional regulator [Streptomyces sp. NPDC094438]|uniref:WhiB family transcriptional regulator n=1 Tax=Streptomyces sp. NPDC094438 TaxID=3366061 RepID=UPI00382D7EC3
MSTSINAFIEAARHGNWGPLLGAAAEVPGKHWAEDARCSGQDTDLFTPLSDGPREDPDEVRHFQGTALNRPLNFCASCPLAVAARCLVESLRLDDEYGIRAGLLASERSDLRNSWKLRIDAEAVSAVLRGVPVALSEAEREEVISRFAADPTMNATHVAWGLGIPRKYLWQLAREHNQSSAPAPSTAISSGADAA